MAGKAASGRRNGEEDRDHRGSLKIRKGEQLFECKRAKIKQLIGRRLPVSTGDRGGGLARVPVKTYGKNNTAGLRYA